MVYSQWQVWEGPVIILRLDLPTFSTQWLSSIISSNPMVSSDIYIYIDIYSIYNTPMPSSLYLTEALQLWPTHEKSLKQNNYFLLMIWSHVIILFWCIWNRKIMSHLQTLDRTARDRSKCCCFQAAWNFWAAFLHMSLACSQIGRSSDHSCSGSAQTSSIHRPGKEVQLGHVFAPIRWVKLELACFLRASSGSSPLHMSGLAAQERHFVVNNVRLNLWICLTLYLITIKETWMFKL